MNGTTLTPRAHQALTRIEEWAHQGPVRRVVVKVGVSVFGPLVVAVGVATTVAFLIATTAITAAFTTYVGTTLV